MTKVLFSLYLLTLLFNFIHPTPKINISINTEDIVNTQKCFDNKQQLNSGSEEDKKMTIYELSNNSTSNTVFIQYKSIKNFVVSESFQDDSSIIYKEASKSGSYYLNMNSAKTKYYVVIENDSNPHKICFISFPEKGKQFHLSEKNANIKLASYDILSSSKLIFSITNKDFKQKNIFYGLRLDGKYMDKIKKPKIQLEASFVNSNRTNEKIVIDDWYVQNQFYYAPYYVPKIKYDEKFCQVLICLDIELKQELSNDETFKFDLELVDSEEIACEHNINVTNNKNNSIVSPKIYYINIKKNIFEFDRDILLLHNDINDKYVKPFFTSNYNVSNNNSALLDKHLVDISQEFLKQEKYAKLPKIELLLIILDEECNNVSDNDNILISFKFFGGYHSLIHYQENLTPKKLFSEKNKLLVRMEHCRTQLYINYFNSEDKNDDRILDIESPIGDMDLYHSNNITGGNIDKYIKDMNNLCVHNIDNSILSGVYNTFKLSCPNLNPVMSYIYAHKKNSVEDTISFINQKSLIYIEYNNQYTFKFNDEVKNDEFDFRIKVSRTNIKENYKIDITYDSQSTSLEREKYTKVFKHRKSSNSNLVIKISSSSSDTKNKGFILEIFKGVTRPENEIIYINKEVEQKDNLPANKVVLFLYDKYEINSAKNKIELYNDKSDGGSKVKICIHRGKGKYPFIILPFCEDEQENIIISPKGSFNISYNNPIINSDGEDDEDNQFYVSILVDKEIKYRYMYEREIDLDENKYIDLNHVGNKIFKLSKKINQKKSIYYQINICANNNTNSNSNLNYIFNNSEPKSIKNDIYQELLLDSIKSSSSSFLIQFYSEGKTNALFKYSYGPANLIKTINNFSKEICLSKSSDDNKLIIKFISPFTEEIEVYILLVPDSTNKFNDFCSLMNFCENLEKKSEKNIKIIKKRIRIKENGENVVEFSVERKELTELMDKNVDIYVITKSTRSNLELSYNIKTIVLDWNKIGDDSNGGNADGQKSDNNNKNLICINCGLNNEKSINNINNDNSQNNDKIEQNNNNNNDRIQNDNKVSEKKENSQNQQVQNNNNNNYNNQNNNLNNNSNNNNPSISNNFNRNSQRNNGNWRNGNINQNNEYNNNNNYNNNQNNYNNNNGNINNQYNRNQYNRNQFNNNKNNNNQYNNNQFNRNQFNNNQNNQYNNKNNNNQNYNNQNNNINQQNQQNQINQNNNNNYNENNSKNRIYNNGNNNNDYNQNNQINNENNNNTNNITFNNMNETNFGGNNTLLNNTIKNNQTSNLNPFNKKKKKKSRKFIYFVFFVIIIICIYYFRNKYNDQVNYSKISKYSYYDF